MKQPPKLYRGIEYCVFSELPPDQQEELSQITTIEFIKILQEDGTLLDQCIQYKDYVQWYESKHPAPADDKVISKKSDVRITYNN